MNIQELLVAYRQIFTKANVHKVHMHELINVTEMIDNYLDLYDENDTVFLHLINFLGLNYEY